MGNKNDNDTFCVFEIIWRNSTNSNKSRISTRHNQEVKFDVRVPNCMMYLR